MKDFPSPCVRPELLAPAGDWDCLRAAIENGADAVYFGLQTGFNARARAANFSLDDLPEALRALHRRGVRGYVTLNPRGFSDELPAIEDHLRRLASAGADAVLVQDLGVARLAREICPDLPLHASTQMTLTSAECLAAVAELGLSRVVLPRELSLKEIRRIHAATAVSLEAFVHGALCVAYSGQCLTSESLGGRSANRGQCAQACRLPYEVLCDGRPVELDDVQYLLSPQDLAAYDLVPQLIDAGVTCFKIEGRLKTAEYVANTTQHYRRAIDAALAGRDAEFSARDVEELELSFSRGFSPGWLLGCHHKRLVPGRSSAKRGVLLGKVRSVGIDRVAVELASSIKRGDGVAFAGDRAAGKEQGGRVYEVLDGKHSSKAAIDSGVVELTFQHGSIDFARLTPGQEVWKTDDPELTARLRKTFSSAEPQRALPLDLTVMARVGEPLVVRGAVGTDTVEVRSEGPLEAARKHPLGESLLREQFARLGGTAYELRGLRAEIDGGPMVPLSVLGKLRHALVFALDEALGRPPARRVAEEAALPRLRPEVPLRRDGEAPRPPELWVLCRSLAQLEAALLAGPDGLYAEFQDIRQYRPAMERARAAGRPLWLATPRIQKPGEMGIFHALARRDADGILARNLAALAFFAERGTPVAADFSLNAANELTCDWLRARGAARITPAYDLNRDQLETLAASVDPDWLEIVIHQHMPMFHMEHCVFCAVLSPGTDKTNCGRPCDMHQVRLRDRIGMEHPLTADVGCRNTLYNAVPQSAAEVVPRLLGLGLSRFRVELLSDGEDAGETVAAYRSLLAGDLRGSEVWQRLRAANRVGVTRGTLEERRNPLAIL